MVIRKGKLHRPCKRCGKSFCPTGEATKVCNDCLPKSKRMKRWFKEQEKRNKK